MRSLAKKLPQPRSFLSRCETGERRANAIKLEDFARLYEMGIGFFLPEFPEGG